MPLTRYEFCARMEPVSANRLVITDGDNRLLVGFVHHRLGAEETVSQKKPLSTDGSSPGRRATLADVAVRAGVSKTTASRMLNRRASVIPVKQETIDRIMAAAADLGYRPNPFAKALTHGHSRVIGVIVRDIRDPFSGVVIDAFSRGAKARGYRVMLSHVGSDPTEEDHFLQLFNDRISDGVLIVGDSPRDGRLATAIADTVEHIVGFARGDSSPRFISVNVDNSRGTNLAIEYLYELGHRRIAHIAGAKYGDLRLRLEAYKQFMASKDIAVPEGYVQVASNDYYSGYQAMLSLLDLARPPTAVYAATDVLAVGALHAAAERGVQVPAELSIIGFDDLAFSPFTRPPLTTIHHPIEEMAQEGASLLVDMIEGKLSLDAPTNYLLEPTLVVRASCAKCPVAKY